MNMQGAIQKEVQRCDTPSTDETNYDIMESQSSLPQLVQLIFVENYTYQELQKYFSYCFVQIEQCQCFIDQIYKSVKIYMDKILQHIKESLFVKPIESLHLKDYVTIIKEINKSYKVTQLKNQELQQVVKSYRSKEDEQQSINCVRLMKYSFINTILKEEQIQLFLNQMKQLFEKKFYSQNQKYYKTKIRLQFLFQLMNSQQLDCIIRVESISKWRFERIQETDSTSTTDAYSIQEQKRFDKKQESKESLKQDEYKKFENNLEEFFQQCKNLEKKEIKVSKQWVNSLKQKIKRK